MAKSSTTRTKKKATAKRNSSSTAKKSPKTKKPSAKKAPAKKASVKKAAEKKTSSAKPAKKKAAKPTSKKKESAGDEIVLVDRRNQGERRDKSQAAPADLKNLKKREKVSRRRQIDPTTCERDYSIEEVEFMAALDEYKRQNGRMFPTCSEILEVIRELGYQKMQKTEAPVVEPMAEASTSPHKIPESPVLSLADDYALPAEDTLAFDF